MAHLVDQDEKKPLCGQESREHSELNIQDKHARCEYEMKSRIR